MSWMRREIQSRLPGLLAEHRYDAVLALPPPLEIAEVVQGAAERANIPFIYGVGDPIGWRKDDGGFEPADRNLQSNLLVRSSAIASRRSAFETYYSDVFRIDSRKVAFFEGSFLPVGLTQEQPSPVQIGENALFHWGQVDPWRPIDTLVDALTRFNEFRPGKGLEPMGLSVMGSVVDDRMRAKASADLGSRFVLYPLMPYLTARSVARTARRFVVIVSPRHMDNIPSKLIDALAYRHPILLLGHPASAAAEMVRRLGVGVVSDIRSSDAVLRGLTELEYAREELEAAYTENAAVEEWSCGAVGGRFCEDLRRVMGW